MLNYVKLNNSLLTTYSDIDECINGSHECHEHATCKNTDGIVETNIFGYTCECKEGFEGTGYDCSGSFHKINLCTLANEIYPWPERVKP